MTENVIGMTYSVCPQCLERIPAKKVRRGGKVFMEKNCPAHGAFSVCIWGDQIPYESWDRPAHKSAVNASVLPKEGCPYDCGLCTQHRQKTCCVLLEVTEKCNLCCPICFASAKKQGKDVPLHKIQESFIYIMKQGGPFNVQLSGGEPTVRDDLDRIIRMGKETGIEFFQLNTNGIRLAQDPGYAKGLADAGLNCVFLQFDGMEDAVYETLRGRRLLDLKKKAIEVCAQLNLGVVLVPVIAKGVNVGNIGPILDFALEQMPVVRGVHFQPLSYFGRYDSGRVSERFTLPDLLQEIEEQTEGRMRKEDFTPGNAENPYCSMSGNFHRLKDGSIKAWQQEGPGSCCQTGEVPECSDRAREFVARQWAGQKGVGNCCNTSSLDAYITSVQINSLAVSAMVFMDAWNLDLQRLSQCYIHEVANQNGHLHLIPFCAYNLTSADGETLYRGQDAYV